MGKAVLKIEGDREIIEYLTERLRNDNIDFFKDLAVEYHTEPNKTIVLISDEDMDGNRT